MGPASTEQSRGRRTRGLSREIQVLDDERMKELNQLEASQSHLALGIFYAREGMIDKAEREFQTLANDNPHSTLTKTFLKEIQAWKNR